MMNSKARHGILLQLPLPLKYMISWEMFCNKWATGCVPWLIKMYIEVEINLAEIEIPAIKISLKNLRCLTYKINGDFLYKLCA